MVFLFRVGCYLGRNSASLCSRILETVMFDLLLRIEAFVFGSIVGSFLNVCILRLPLDQSIVKPRSRCPQCGQMIRWFDNIPILSWVLLRGRCRFCKKGISWRYPFIELLSGLLAWAFVVRFGIHWWVIVYYLFSASLLVVAVIDIDHRIIPNEISLSGIVLGFVLSFFLPGITWLDSLLGAFLGGGLLFAIAEIYRLLRKIEGMGMGDVKLLGMIGAFLGWRALPFVVLLSSAAGTIVGLLLIVGAKKGWRYQIPFGTFLAGAAVAYTLFAHQIETFVLTSLRVSF